MIQTRSRIEIIFQELFRQALHCGVALFIIPLRWLGFEYALIFALSAFFWNLLIMPRWFGEAFRVEEKAKGYSVGMLSYPLAIFLLGLFFPLPILAGGWAVLSLADGLATLGGRFFGKKILPWNHHKSWVGFLIFFLCAGIFGWISFIWTWENIQGSSWLWLFDYRLENFRKINLLTLLGYSLVSGLFASLIESLPVSKIDDNLSAPLAYAFLFWMLVLFFSR